MVILIMFLSVISAILYRAGGMGKEVDHWIPGWMRQSWVRDWLCPLCALLPLFIIHPSWLFVLAYPALAGALSTYWDVLFGFDNFWFAGFMCGVAALMLTFCGFPWRLLLVRALVLAVLWGGISAIFKNDFIEEYSRGFTLSFPSVLFLSA